MNILILMDMPLFPYRIYAYNELAKRGYHLTVVSLNNADVSYDIKCNFKHIRLSYIQFIGFRFIRGFSKINFDDYSVIIVAPNLRLLNYYKFYRKKYWNKLIGWGHHKGCSTGNSLASWMRLHFFKKFKALVFYDPLTKEEYIHSGFDSKNLFVANNTQYVDNKRVRLEKGKTYFLYVGRIQERKRLDLAILAFSELKHQVSDEKLKFKIVGGGNFDDLYKLAKELKIENDIIFIGPTHDEDKLSELYSSAIAYVSPGHVGLGVLHSFAFGVPVITCLERRHSVEFGNCKPENSFVVQFNKESIAESMITLYQNKELQQQMSLAAYNYYNKYCTIRIMVDGLEDAIIYSTRKRHF